MWRADPTLCAACGLAYNSHSDEKCLYEHGTYLKAALETRWYGFIPGMTIMRYAWVCYECKATHEDTMPLPGTEHEMRCRLPNCGKLNLVAAP